MIARTPTLEPPAADASAEGLGFWSAAIATLAGAIYVLVLVVLAAAGQMVMPPPQPVQLFGSIITMVMAPVLVVLFACVHRCTPDRKKVWSLNGLAFTVLFAAMVTISRYVQLTVIRQGLARGLADQLQPFMVYGDNSVMLALEYLGWAFFLSLAGLFMIPVFARPGLERWLRGLFATYGVLGLTGALGLALGSPISAVGFVAWGPVLTIIAGLLTIWFWREAKEREATVPLRG